VKGDKGDPGKDGTEIKPEEIREKLESLQDEERLDASAVKNLEQFVTTKIENKALTLSGLGGAGETEFIGLTDTPETYEGQSNKFVKVKADEEGLEFVSSTAAVAWDGITGDQSTVNLSGFTNDSGFITEATEYTAGDGIDITDNIISNTDKGSDVVVPTKTSDLTNDSGFITDYTVTSTDVTQHEGDVDHDALKNYEAGEHIDWSITQTSDIHPDNYTDTTYTDTDFDISDISDSLGKRAEWDAKWDYDEDTIKAVKVDNAVNADTVNSLTVETAVPTGAVFTDTTYTASDFNHNDLSNIPVNDHLDWTTTQTENIHSDNYTDTTYTNSDFDHDQLTNYVAAEHVDWASSQLTDIHPDNYIDTTYTASDFNHDDLSNIPANDHIDWTAESAGTIHVSNYVDNDTTYTAGDGLSLVGTEFQNSDKGSDVPQSDWNQTTDTEQDFIKNKITFGDGFSVDENNVVTFSATGRMIPGYTP
jgi:hypothetical protein